MPYNKKDDRKNDGKSYGKTGRREENTYKPDTYKKDRKPLGSRQRPDKDELAPPRFIPKRSDTVKTHDRPFGNKKKDGDGHYANKRNDGKQPGVRRNPAAPWDKDDLANSRFFNKNKPEPGETGPVHVRKNTAGPRAPKTAKDGPQKRFVSKPGDIQEKKPFRPKYEPEIKLPKHSREKTKTPRERKKELGVVDDPTDIRLNKYIANSGICSRREADELIRKGLVTVNGQVVTEMGHKVKREDEVRYEGRKILPEPFVYILMNKPKDFITTTDDEKGRKTVMDLLADKIPQRVYPVGRLDRNTTGVLLLTNDGEVAQALTHPAFEIKKVYHVVLDKKMSSADLDKLVTGITLEDGDVFADAVTFVDNEDKRHVGVEIHSGKNRVVRRMFEHLGYEVEKLDRVSMGVFTKKDLPRGKWRHLSQAEVGFLMKLKHRLNS